MELDGPGLAAVVGVTDDRVWNSGRCWTYALMNLRCSSGVG